MTAKTDPRVERAYDALQVGAADALEQIIRDLLASYEEARQYAFHLATVLAQKHYPEVTQWEPLPDLLGLLTQIDNMTSGLTRYGDWNGEDLEEAIWDAEVEK